MELNDIVFLGTTLKISASAIGTPSVNMSDCDFDIYAWCSPTDTEFVDMPSSSFVKKNKNECIPIDSNTYSIEVPTSIIGKGFVVCKLVLHVPDADCANGTRTEVMQGLPHIKVV